MIQYTIQFPWVNHTEIQWIYHQTITNSQFLTQVIMLIWLFSLRNFSQEALLNTDVLKHQMEDFYVGLILNKCCKKEQRPYYLLTTAKILLYNTQINRVFMECPK